MAFKDSNSPKNNDFWSYAEQNYQEVAKWPTWMRGESSASDSPSTSSDSRTSAPAGSGEEEPQRD